MSQKTLFFQGFPGFSGLSEPHECGENFNNDVALLPLLLAEYWKLTENKILALEFLAP